jgi:hypothetical protein
MGEPENMFHQAGKRWLAAILMAVLLGACATFTSLHSTRQDRGIKAPHKAHAKESMACTDCHADNDKGEPGMPNHEMCGACHDFDVDKPDDKCAFCHTRPDQKVDALAKALSAETKFNHKAHTDKKVECATCHTDPDKGTLPAGDKMKWCVDCHEKNGAGKTDCAVCHSEISKSVRPKTYRGTRLPHDNPQMWETTHGRQSQRDPEFCNLCHDKETSCEECHRKNPPSSHNMAWRERTHGLRAQWDRQKCAACHEEDSCIRCHKQSQPRSHRGGWGEPLNRHCINCHYPPSDTGCTACHEDIVHPRALASPHVIGLYGNCGMCHPGGVPYRAPHIMNTSIKCLACH